jgi:hypothetical protein
LVKRVISIIFISAIAHSIENKKTKETLREAAAEKLQEIANDPQKREQIKGYICDTLKGENEFKDQYHNDVIKYAKEYTAGKGWGGKAEAQALAVELKRTIITILQFPTGNYKYYCI